MNEAAIVMVLVGIAFISRYPPLMIMRQVRLPERASHTLRFMPIAALIAITMPTIFVQEGAVTLSVANPYLIGAVAAVVLALRSRRMLLVIVGSLAVFLAAKLLLGG